MLLGYNTNGFAHHRLEDAVIILSGLGYRSIAITLDYHALNPFDPELSSQLAVVRSLLEARGLDAVIETGARFLLNPERKHSPTLISGLPNRTRRLDFLKRAIDIAALMKPHTVSFWSGKAEEIDDPRQQMDLLVEGCQSLCEYARNRGVRLAFEPEPGMVIDTMNRFAELHARVDHPAFGLTLDIGHLHCLGEVPFLDHFERWKNWLWNVHLEDMRRGVHDHLMFGDGEIDFTEVFRGLAQIDYRHGIHVELSRHSYDAVETAREAMSFLRAALSS